MPKLKPDEVQRSVEQEETPIEAGIRHRLEAREAANWRMKARRRALDDLNQRRSVAVVRPKDQ